MLCELKNNVTFAKDKKQYIKFFLQFFRQNSYTVMDKTAQADYLNHFLIQIL